MNFSETDTVNEGKLLEESDLALLDALQVNPRASWTALAEVLDLAPISLARRWQRLTEEGAAWTTVALGHTHGGALVEYGCRPGTADRVAQRLAALPHLVTVCVTTGEHQVFGLLSATSPASATRMITECPPELEDVLSVRISVYTKVFGGIIWRLGVINRRQAEHLRDPLGEPPARLRPFGAADRALFLALTGDGRRSYTELAEELNTSAQAVKRRLDRLRRNGDIVFRCDLARPLAGWESMAMFWLSAPTTELDAIGARLGAFPETRHCSSTTGTANMLLIASLHGPDQLDELALRIAREHPEVAIVERKLMLRQVKVYGRMLDGNGCCVRTISVDPWYQGEQ
ncbi:Lrp/AsnC family transcriptional regulator [Sciscionella sediminilitoris]|uniref:Lrp/AsnC family transcriptional regulator n=1 Tax=Sciscionella sediminilitoris TaxID=1445613 RepID=UPI00068B7817|nr:AsnC family transcriptional regulator [Sciscionella sp. SE31]